MPWSRWRGSGPACRRDSDPLRATRPRARGIPLSPPGLRARVLPARVLPARVLPARVLPARGLAVRELREHQARRMSAASLKQLEPGSACEGCRRLPRAARSARWSFLPCGSGSGETGPGGSRAGCRWTPVASLSRATSRATSGSHACEGPARTPGSIEWSRSTISSIDGLE